MRSVVAEHRCFSTKIMVGLVVGCVLFLIAGATRRRQRVKVVMMEGHGFIDGVRRPSEVELEARPQEEANAASGRLVSEADDVSPLTQRW